jgi:hypothetical protein
MTTFCPYAKSDMSPCVLRDGAVSFAMDTRDNPICVSCGRSPKSLGIPRPAGWEKTVADYKRNQEKAKR